MVVAAAVRSHYLCDCGQTNETTKTTFHKIMENEPKSKPKGANGIGCGYESE